MSLPILHNYESRAQATEEGRTRLYATAVAMASIKDAEAYYPSTANPDNVQNIELHRQRFRNGETRTHDYFTKLYESDEWRKNHTHYNDTGVTRFFIALKAQRFLYAAQVLLVDQPYTSWGKTEGSWDNYTLMMRNGWSVGDLRKPVKDDFQRYLETIYRPLMCCLLFGKDGWKRIRRHWGTFKSCTIKVCEGDQNFLGKQVFHLHIDGRVGLLQERNYSQKHMSRLLFSVVTDVLQDEDDTMPSASQLQYGTTVYPIWQPKKGFASNQQLHSYLQDRYLECGLQNSGLPRPHYGIPEELIYRARSGEVLFHFTHSSETSGPQAIHSEPNPCPDRHLFVFDWNNIISKDASGKYLPSVEVPEDEIIECMRALETHGSSLYQARLHDVEEMAHSLLEVAEAFPEGQRRVQELIELLREERQTCVSAPPPSSFATGFAPTAPPQPDSHRRGTLENVSSEKGTEDAVCKSHTLHEPGKLKERFATTLSETTVIRSL